MSRDDWPWRTTVVGIGLIVVGTSWAIAKLWWTLHYEFQSEDGELPRHLIGNYDGLVDAAVGRTMWVVGSITVIACSVAIRQIRIRAGLPTAFETARDAVDWFWRKRDKNRDLS